MNRLCIASLVLLICFVTGCNAEQAASTKTSQQDATQLAPAGRGPYSVGSTNMEVAPEFAEIGDDAMHAFLLGVPTESGQSRYVADILKYPEAAWVTDVVVPDDATLFGPASGQSLPVVTFLTYPSSVRQHKDSYAFPYHDGQYGVFEDMLGPGEAPSFADPDARYPLVILAHGASAHGIFDVRHAHDLASHGYIVAVLNYGDDRTARPEALNPHVGFLRPLLTRAVLDAVLKSESFGPHVDAENIGISGHSFGGFTALAVTGGQYLGNAETVNDPRIKAGVIAAPWVGGNYDGNDLFAFGPDNSGLSLVTAPMISFFSWKDEATLASFILPALKQLSGPRYVVELVDQPHVFEGGSWQDRDGWEKLFFDAYLKNEAAALEALQHGRSMQGGNEDRQLFDYQRLPASD